MIIGVPKEIKPDENRAALTPASAYTLIGRGHQVFIEKKAGAGSGFSDEEYQKAGCMLLDSAEEVWSRADMVMKVKEPIPAEYPRFRKGLLLFTYLHLAADRALTEALVESGVTGIAYETVQASNGALPLLTPMSEVAGRMSVQAGAHYLQKAYGGKGVLLGGVPGVLPAKVVILGGGVVGTNAAKMAMGLGADVTILDRSLDRLRQLDDQFGARLQTLYSNPYNVHEAARAADLLIGAVLIPGAKAPRLVTEETVRQMTAGSVIVDVAVDQGGSIETIDRVTTHSHPVYEVHGVLHYAVGNMPGAVPRTSTLALNNATLPYAMELADKGLKAAAQGALATGVNVHDGKITYKAVADAHQMAYSAWPAS
ncbi:alanine dehydrogenase [Paenibacillus aurantius]|uniref:Alanine dehydrogenase n=1 Tax=Paenibacillus aurantius TaxID=2918900 RepID=A0AA96LIA2_9BACL|nr:alanine dehydrogenase [Paenibacillus aurantius]WNQ13819.1 alanine dehydrogenase [Paenibacillus aurantius]